MPNAQTAYRSLRLVVLAATGQDVRQCCTCGLCSAVIGDDEADGLEQWVQWIIVDDERALTLLPAHADQILREAQQVCTNRLDFLKTLDVLCAEARRRGLLTAA
ncbi:MAG TPA: hypothetical protein VFF59_10580 [Anaerolineae bacterium]|nr:hypothetical protein [Anaerolineae bacterium]